MRFLPFLLVNCKYGLIVIESTVVLTRSADALPIKATTIFFNVRCEVSAEAEAGKDDAASSIPRPNTSLLQDFCNFVINRRASILQSLAQVSHLEETPGCTA